MQVTFLASLRECLCWCRVHISDHNRQSLGAYLRVWSMCWLKPV